MSRAIDASRLARALAIVVVLLLAVPVADALLQRDGADVLDVAAEEGITAREIIGEGDPLQMLDRLEGVLVDESQGLPDGLADEVGCLPAYRDLRVGADGSVVSYVVDGDASDISEALRTHMEGKGWARVPLGGVEGATYVKEGGEYTWVLATCTQVGDATSVVLGIRSR